MKKKQILIRSGVLFGVFIFTLLIMGIITNIKKNDQSLELDAPTLPSIFFVFEGHEVNHITGYVNDMDITAMRDTVIPIAQDGTLTMQLDKHGNKIDSISYEVYTLTGDKKIKEGSGKEKNDEVILDLRGALEEAKLEEAVLKVTLISEEKPIHYYLRIEQPDHLSTKACLDFANDFHTHTFEKDKKDAVEQYLEPNPEKADNTSYQTVTIQSNVENVMWGDLNPTITSDILWSIKESNQTYTSILAEYQVTSKGEAGEDYRYNVKEFFRVRVAGSSIFLLNYNRTMNQIFLGDDSNAFSEEGICVGITEPDLEYDYSEKSNTVAFVQERELWMYNKKENTLLKIFGFNEDDVKDFRYYNNQHDVRIISMDENGSVTFAVYGYMNRGMHEGQVGVDIFFYNAKEHVIEEKAFIPIDRSFAMAEEELGKLVYYSHQQNLLYVLAGGNLYKVNLQDGEREKLVKDLKKGQYVVSEDGHLLAYQEDGKLDSSTVVKVVNLENGTEQQVKAKKGENIRPLRFIFNDFICGFSRPEEKGTTISGNPIVPMYKLEIRNHKNKVVKEYQVDSIYISDIAINDNLITINRLQEKEGSYIGVNADYITNNEEKKDNNIILSNYVSDKYGTQYYIAFKDGLSDDKPKYLITQFEKPKNNPIVALDIEQVEGKYLVYGTGEVAGIYDKASYAIARADELCGVVITTDQKYVWVRGNRDLVYHTHFPTFTIPEGDNSYQACEKQLAQFNGTKVDLSGCNVSQVCYFINQGIPVIAMIDADTAILLTGYTETTITYIDPFSGSENTVSVDEMTNMVSGSGNTFIGFIK